MEKENQLFIYYISNVDDETSMKRIELNTSFPSVSHGAYSEEEFENMLKTNSEFKEKWVNSFLEDRKKTKNFTYDEMEVCFKEGFNLCLSNFYYLLKGKIHPNIEPFETPAMEFEEYIQSLKKD